MFHIYVSGRSGIYGHTADEPPAKGDVVLLNASDLRVRNDDVAVGDHGEARITASPE